MPFARSLRALSRGDRRPLASAVLVVSLAVACGGGGQPQPTSAPTTAPAAPSVVASPQRPTLASPAPSPVPTAGATTGEGSEQTYEVQPGDTLLSIAEQFYDDATKWRRIYDANKDVIGDNPDSLKLGTKLKIPPKEES